MGTKVAKLECFKVRVIDIEANDMEEYADLLGWEGTLVISPCEAWLENGNLCMGRKRVTVTKDTITINTVYGNKFVFRVLEAKANGRN